MGAELVEDSNVALFTGDVSLTLSSLAHVWDPTSGGA